MCVAMTCIVLNGGAPVLDQFHFLYHLVGSSLHALLQFKKHASTSGSTSSVTISTLSQSDSIDSASHSELKCRVPSQHKQRRFKCHWTLTGWVDKLESDVSGTAQQLQVCQASLSSSSSFTDSEEQTSVERGILHLIYP